MRCVNHSRISKTPMILCEIISNRKKVRGFSLIELVITLALIGIAAAIALPSYQSSTRKSNRSDGEALLMGISARMEMARYQSGVFTDDLTALNFPTSSGVASREGYYTASVQTPTAGCPIDSCYVLRATPVAAQIKDGILELTSTGIKRRDKNGDGDAIDADEEGWK